MFRTCGNCANLIPGDFIIANMWFRNLTMLVLSMFLSRTVAAEVCMEVRSNEPAYAALKKLNESGDLLFELSCVIKIVL